MVWKQVGLYFLVFLMFISSAFAATDCYNASADPVPLCTCEDLNLTHSDVTADYQLQNNIDCSNTSVFGHGLNNGGSGWDPVGPDLSTRFTGTLDGQGYNITNLYINRSGEDYNGLFGVLSTPASVTDLGVVNVTINGSEFNGGITGRTVTVDIFNSFVTGLVVGVDYVAGIVGYSGDIHLNNSYSTATIINRDTTAGQNQGGLIGYLSTSALIIINNSYATGDVTGFRNSGGLIGQVQTTTGDQLYVENSYATGDITVTDGSSDGYAGGIVGTVNGWPSGASYYVAIFRNVYATGNVTPVSGSGTYTGGFAGWLRYNVLLNNTYARGNVSGTQNTGGFVGGIEGTWPAIQNSYSTGAVSGSSNVGGLVGLDGGSNCAHSFWDNETSGQSSSDCANETSGTTDGNTGKSTAEMKNISTFTNTTTDGLGIPWDFRLNPHHDSANENHWDINASLNDGYPFLVGVGIGANVDGTIPVVTQERPIDGNATAASSANITFNCTVTDNVGLENLSLYITDSSNSNFVLNQTANVTGTSNSSNWTLELSTGSYTWGCLAYDTSDNLAWSDNRSVYVDPSVVSLSLLFPTNHTNVTQDEFFNVSVNVSCTLGNCGEVNVTVNFSNTSSIFNEEFENTSTWSTSTSNSDCANKGDFDDCDDNSGDYDFYLDADQYSGTYALQFDDWDTFDYSKGLWENITPLTGCDGFSCDDYTISFYEHNYGLDSGDYCIVWARYSNGTTLDLWRCDDGDSCDDGTTDSSPESNDYVFRNVSVSDLGLDLNQSEIEIHIGARVDGSSDYCFWDEFNITGVDNAFITSANLTQNITLDEDESVQVDWEFNASGADGDSMKFSVYATRPAGSIAANETTRYNLTISNAGNSGPSVTIDTPSNNLNSTDTGLDVNYTVVDSELDSCWYSNDSGATNASLAGCANITGVTWTESEHNVTVYANDTNGNEGSAVVTFTVDASGPAFTNFSNQSIIDGDSLAYDINATDANGIGCYSVNNTANFTINCSGYLQNNSLLGAGVHSLNITVNDTFGNEFSRILVVNVSILDADGDGIKDRLDALEYNESNVSTSGITSLNITVGGNITNSLVTGMQEMKFYDQGTLFMNFSHNFTAGNFSLADVAIVKATNSLLINLSSQLQSNLTKDLHISDNSFIALCVKDAEIASVSNISSACNQSNEINFTGCIGNATGVTLNGTTCIDSGSTITIQNLSSSAIRGTPTPSSSSGSSGGSGGGGGGSITRRECNDKKDNDGDGYIDFPNDPDCIGPSDRSESPEEEPKKTGSSFSIPSFDTKEEPDQTAESLEPQEGEPSAVDSPTLFTEEGTSTSVATVAISLILVGLVLFVLGYIYYNQPSQKKPQKKRLRKS